MGDGHYCDKCRQPLGMACRYCETAETSVDAECETISRVVAWLRANRPGEPTAVRFGHYFADAMERGDWKGGDDER